MPDRASLDSVKNVFYNLQRMIEYVDETDVPQEEEEKKNTSLQAQPAIIREHSQDSSQQGKRKKSAPTEQYLLYSEMSQPDMARTAEDCKIDAELIMVSNIIEILYQATKQMSEEEKTNCHPFLLNLQTVTQWCHDEKVPNVAVPSSAYNATINRTSGEDTIKSHTCLIKGLEITLESVQASIEHNVSSLSGVRESIGSLSEQLVEQNLTLKRQERVMAEYAERFDDLDKLKKALLTTKDGQQGSASSAGSTKFIQNQVKRNMERLETLEKSASAMKSAEDQMGVLRLQVNELRRDYEESEKIAGKKLVREMEISIKGLTSQVQLLESRPDSRVETLSELNQQIKDLTRKTEQQDDKINLMVNNTSPMKNQSVTDVDQKFQSLNNRISNVEKSREQTREQLEEVSQVTHEINRKNASMATTLDVLLQDNKGRVTDVQQPASQNDNEIASTIKSLEQKVNSIEEKVSMPSPSKVELNPEVVQHIANVNTEALASMRQQIENLSKTVSNSEAIAARAAERFDLMSSQMEEGGRIPPDYSSSSPGSSNKRRHMDLKLGEKANIGAANQSNWNVPSTASPSISTSVPAAPATAFEKRMQVLEERHARLRQALKRDDY